jgi:hypothetical protein
MPDVTPESNPSPSSKPAQAANPQAAGEDGQTPGRGPDRRQSVVDRRAGVERRQQTREESGYTGPVRRVAAADRRAPPGLGGFLI